MRLKRKAARKIDKFRVTVYWLIPAEPYCELFRELIRILAKRLDAPRFEPHLTLCVAPQHRPSPRNILRKVRAAPVRLRVREVGYSSKFTKTLFVRFAPTKSLDRLVVDLATGRVRPTGGLAGTAKPLRDPHVSLLYKKIPARTKKELAATINLPFRKVAFDMIKAVRCPLPTKRRADVEAWRVIATKSLR